MTWNEASELLKANIEVGQHIDSKSVYRYVLKINHICSKYDYTDEGFLITIGKRNNRIEIPTSMLRTLFKASQVNGGIYNNAVIKECFPLQVQDHSCHVHVIGKLFTSAKVMQPVSTRSYQILKQA